MPFAFHPQRIPDVILVEARSAGDERGLFRELWRESDFAAHGIDLPFVQDNHSRSIKSVLRGLHFQKPPHAQGKLVFAPFGEVLDIAVDIRAGSPTYGQHVSAILSGDNGHALWVPPGFAHGFAVLSDIAYLIYKVTDVYAPQCDAGIAWNDPDLGIDWRVSEPLLSPKDQTLPRLREAETGFNY